MRTTGDGIHIQLLGPIRAWRDGHEIVLGPPKQRAVLALLATRAGDVVGIEQIIDAVWGSDIPRTAANGVHTYVAGLRRTLEPGRSRRGTSSVLASAAGGYCLRIHPDSVDVGRFAQRHARARRARADSGDTGAPGLYEEALSLWRGEAFAGIPGPFAAVERTRLHDLKMTAVEEWASDMLAVGRHGEVVADLSAAVAEEPLREKLSWLLMLALYRCDRQAHALSVYDGTRRLLSQELGIEPGVELRTLHQEILRGRAGTGTADREQPYRVPTIEQPRGRRTEPGPGPAVQVPEGAYEHTGQALPDTPRPAQLPPLARGFVGRRAELARLEEVLTEGEAEHANAGTRVAVVNGLAGVGKTAVVLEVAHRHRGRFPDGQLFVAI